MRIRRGLAVSVAVLVLAGCSRPPAPAHESPGPAECPATDVVADSDDGDSTDVDGRHAQLVPVNASGGWLCDYAIPRDGSRVWPITERTALVRPAPNLVAYLNDLRTRDDHHMCAAMLGPQQYVVLSYPDGGSATVTVDIDCGTVSRDGVTREYTTYHALMAFFGR